MSKTATLKVFGDELKVIKVGSMWQAPCNGTQHPSCTAAMRGELEAYLSASGENVSEMEEEIDAMLDKVQY